MPLWLLKLLDEVAKDRDISPNTLHNQILTRFLTFEVFIEKINPMIVAEATMLAVIDGYAPEEIQRRVSEPGSTVLNSLFTLHNIKPSLDSFMEYFIRPMGKYSGWFSVKYYAEEKKIILIHSKGTKWSHFLAGHVGASIRSVLKIEPRIEITKSSVILHL